MAKAFYGRVSAYDHGLMSDNEILDEAVLRNIFRGEHGNRDCARMIASYIREQVAALDCQSVDALLSGRVRFTTSGTDNDGKSNSIMASS